MNRFTWSDKDGIYRKTGYTIGEIVNQLCKYEDLGYTPEQLEQIIRLYNIYKLQAHSTFGLCSGTKVGPDKLEVNIPKLIDEAMEKRDRSVSLYIGEAGTSINIYPWPEEDCDG